MERFHFGLWELLAAFSVPAFLFAVLHAFFHQRQAHLTALFACLLSLPILVITEYSPLQFGANSWTAFNLPDNEIQWVINARWKITAVSAVVISLFSCTLRFLPREWKLRNFPMRETTWPAFACFAPVLLFWYCSGASPYRIPIIVDGMHGELTILHVLKHGSQFHETSVEVFRDGKFYRQENNRRFFQYRFPVFAGSTVSSSELTQDAIAFSKSTDLNNLKTPPPVKLRRWEAEGWYVLSPRGVFAFTSENGSAAPASVISLFERLDKLPLRSTPYDQKDICFGFCYDPWAGLGSLYLNQRCATSDSGQTHCRVNWEKKNPPATAGFIQHD